MISQQRLLQDHAEANNRCNDPCEIIPPPLRMDRWTVSKSVWSTLLCISFIDVRQPTSGELVLSTRQWDTWQGELEGEGVRQGGIMSPVLFLIAIDRLIRKKTTGACRGIQWTSFSYLEYLDFADDDLISLSATLYNLKKLTVWAILAGKLALSSK